MAVKCPRCHSAILDDSRFCGKCGTPIQATAEERAAYTKTLATPSRGISLGSLLAGKFRIMEEIGRGGMGVVYRAEDMKLKRSVALKFLPPELSSDPEARERFFQEARAAAALSHPNICTIHEVDESEDKSFIAMEYVEGENLREKIKKGPLSVEATLDIAIQAAEGLEKAHQKGIVHRDIKSANIMVTEGGQAKVMDFGLAKLHGGSAFTKEGATLGTVAYMSPEQARGENVDGRTDIWSLGVVLYEMLTGGLPFKGERDVSILYSIVHEDPKALKDKKPPVPAELQRVVEKALAKSPDSRYQTAAEMARDLRGYRDALRMESAGVFNLRSVLKRFRRPAAAIPSAVALVAIVVVAGWFFPRQAKIHRAKNELLPQIAELAGRNFNLLDSPDFIKIYELAVEAERVIPNDPRLADIFRNFSLRAAIVTEPPGAKVFVKGYQAPEKEWDYLGVSPVENIRFPLELLRLKLEKEGYETVQAASTDWGWDVNSGAFVLLKILRRLDQNGEIPSGMVRIPGSELKGIGKLDDFFMDRFEVTNKQYKEFVEKGGYQKKELWKNEFFKEGKALIWEQALAEFVDSTGRPGPATWQAGDYPEGQDDFPVSGVSWYEAAAYAEFVHKSLPTGSHWGLASGPRITADFFTPQSNFKGKGPDRVGSNPAITAYGISDMGGNVREWCSNETPQGRLLRGGAWNDAIYMFTNLGQAAPFDRSAQNGFRCAIYIHPERIPQSAFTKAEIPKLPDFRKQEPVADSVFRVYKEQYSYDKRNLNARVEWRDETSKDWVQEKVSFDAAYENERVFAYLFLPKNGAPPFQTVIYFPGAGSAATRSSKDMDKWEEFQPFIVKNGRAFLYPVYKGTFERGDDALFKISGGDDSYQYVEYFIKVVKDFKRSVDYLETRSDIDGQKLAYLGLSWGARYGAIIPAVEDRLKASVLRAGGFTKNIKIRPEVSQINYVGRVKIPTLMLNGRYDMVFFYEAQAKPMFDLLGTPPERKELKSYDTDHFTPGNEFIKETLRWLDKYLGPVKK